MLRVRLTVLVATAAGFLQVSFRFPSGFLGCSAGLQRSTAHVISWRLVWGNYRLVRLQERVQLRQRFKLGNWITQSSSGENCVPINNRFELQPSTWNSEARHTRQTLTNTKVQLRCRWSSPHVISLSILIWLMEYRWHIMTFSSWAEHFPQAVVRSVFCPVHITAGSHGRSDCREAPCSAACSASVSILTSLLFSPRAESTRIWQELPS